MKKEVKVYTLKRPVTSGEYTCTELRFKRPDTRDFIAAGDHPMDTMEAMAAFISSNTGVPRAVVDRIDIDDLSVLRIEVGRVFGSYMMTKPYAGSGRGSGEYLSLDEARDRVASMAALILALLPGMDYGSVMDMAWEELSFWHNKAVETAKILRGIE